jgi:hypothetical protein
MKKLLVILLLLFPVHRAWAAANVESFFGYKFGMSYDDIPKESIRTDLGIENEYISILITEPLVKNKEFEIYGLYFTPLTKKLYAIRAKKMLEAKWSNWDYCIDTIRAMQRMLTKKYNFAKPNPLYEEYGPRISSDTSKKKWRHLEVGPQIELKCDFPYESSSSRTGRIQIDVTNLPLQDLRSEEEKKMKEEKTDFSGF